MIRQLTVLLAMLSSTNAYASPVSEGVDFSKLPPTWPMPSPTISLDALVSWSTSLTMRLPGDKAPITIFESRGGPVPKTLTVPQEPPEPKVDGLRVSLIRKDVEFDGKVIINVHDRETPIVYVEALVCRPDSLEHESLVMTNIPASFIHAGLLAIGLKPGEPGSITFEPGTGRLLSRKEPKGDEVIIEMALQSKVLDEDDARQRDRAFRPITSYLTTTKGPLNLGPFVFAGSRFVDDVTPESLTSIRAQANPKPDTKYLADAIGSVIGLHTFGVEMVANTTVLSPDSGADAPYIIAAKSLPKVGTPVTIRIRPAKK